MVNPRHPGDISKFVDLDLPYNGSLPALKTASPCRFLQPLRWSCVTTHDGVRPRPTIHNLLTDESLGRSELLDTRENTVWNARQAIQHARQSEASLDHCVPLIEFSGLQRPMRAQPIIGRKVGWTQPIILTAMPRHGDAAAQHSRPNPVEGPPWWGDIGTLHIVNKGLGRPLPREAL